MKNIINIFFISVLGTTVYCKKQAGNSLVSHKDTLVQNNAGMKELENQIRKDVKILKRESLNIDNDNKQEYIVTTQNHANTTMYEYWFKDNKLMATIEFPVFDINYRWLADLDNDGRKEIIRAQGYEDGIDYTIYSLKDGKQIPQLYFNPALSDKRYPKDVFWGYPWDMKEIDLNANKELLVSINNQYERDGNYNNPEDQKELPFIFFKGETTQPEIKVTGIHSPQLMSLEKLQNQVKGSTKANNKKGTAVIDEIKADLNKDGYPDKIEILKNYSYKDGFDQEHFMLPVKIYKGTAKDFQEWKTSDNIIYNKNNNCTAEGYSRLITKDNYFTIEAQTCYDYNILVNGYITFKVSGNEIYLHKYGEEYFDKSNHVKKMPSKTWTTKEFGMMKFQQVTSDFLQGLRTKVPQ